MTPNVDRIIRCDMRPGLPGTLAPRRGFSLIEVILATAILLGSVVVLAELAGLGRRQSEKGQKLAAAQLLWEHTLNEVLIGLRPLEPLEQEPLLPAERPIDTAVADRAFDDLAADTDPFPIDDETSLAETTAEIDQTEAAEWVYSLRLTPLEDRPGIAVLTVVVEQPPEATTRPVRFELSRWIDDPMAAASEDDFRQPPNADFAAGGEPLQ